jgi:endoglucanase
MKRVYTIIGTVLPMCLILFSGCISTANTNGTGSNHPAAAEKEATTEIVLTAECFNSITAGSVLSITTASSGTVAEPSVTASSHILKLCRNDSLLTALSGGTYSANTMYNGTAGTVTLAEGRQTTTYTITSADKEALKTYGLAILGYGVTVTKIINPAASSDIYEEGVTVNTVDSSKEYFAKNLSSGWNLGNYLDSYGNTGTYSNIGYSNSLNWCGAEASKELFAGVKNEGVDFVRIPVTWMNHIGSAPSYTINSKWMTYVKKVVNMALAEGLVVVINMHHDGVNTGHWLDISKADNSDADFVAQTAEFTALWSQIANEFKDYGSNLMFESFNELQDGKWGWGANKTDGGVQYSILNKWNQAFVTTVRATGSNNQYRYLAINGYSADPDLTAKYLTIPLDTSPDGVKRIAVSFHYYQPTDFGIEASVHKWGGYYGGVTTGCSSWGQEDFLIQTFDKFFNTFSDYAIYIGEYGATYQGTKYVDYQRYYDEFLAHYAHSKGMVPVAWDNNARSSSGGKECFGLFDRSTGSIRPQYSSIAAGIKRATASAYDISSIPAPVEQ